MRIHNRSFLLSLLVPAYFTVSGADVEAQEQGISAAKSGRWSDRSTWTGGAVPAAGNIVTIGDGMDVVLDVSPPGLNGIHLDGRLSFSNDADLELTTEWITVTGELAIGSETSPHTRNATITLTDNVKDEDMMAGMGDRGIMIVGGTLNLHGDRKNAWTKLAETAAAGSARIQVLNASEWRVGDRIVLASTDYDPHQAETRTIVAINGNTLMLDQPLEYMHFGKITFDVDERGEVGLLTRNILIQSSPDSQETMFGGHIMALAGSTMHVSGVELNHMGQNMHLARYPIHWHLAGDVQGQYIENSSIHDTYSRCVTVHGTNYLRVENNVTYNNIGHCFFLEDGIEHDNQFIHNLGILTKCHPDAPCVPTNLAAAGEPRNGSNGQAADNVLIPSDNTVSTFWITNPGNIYIDNVAAGSDATGFWMSLPEHPTGAFEGTAISANSWPRRTPFLEFRGNVSHSNYDGFMFDRNVSPDGTFGVTGSAHMPKEDPADPDSKSVESVFEDLTTYKNRNGGIWGRGELHTFRNVRFADNAMGFTHATGSRGRDLFTSRVIDSLFVGETENVGNPGTPEELAYGRSLPKPSMPDFPIRGYEYYDYRHDVVNTTFVNFEDNDTRMTGALSYLMYTSAGISTENTIERAKFVNAKPVYFPSTERKWGNDNGSRVAWNTAVFHDKDGSVGGIPDSYILINDGVNDSIAADTEACEIKPNWNAAVCRGDIGRLSVGGASGVDYGAPGIGPPRARGAAAEPPVVLSRNGRDFNLTRNQSNVRAGTEIKLSTESPEVSIGLWEMDEGSWVIFQLPGFAIAASGSQQDSLDALRKASGTSYFKDQGALWVKLVSNGDGARGPIGGGLGGGTSIRVRR